MCGHCNRRCGCCGCGARTAQVNGGCCCCANTCSCGCRCCGCEDAAPTATISMADFQPFILVPTAVFDSGDMDCDCGCDRGCDW